MNGAKLIDLAALAFLVAFLAWSAVRLASDLVRYVKYRRARARLRLVTGGAAAKPRQLRIIAAPARRRRPSVRAASHDAVPLLQHRRNR
jgi:hypothetical protein